MDWVAKWWADGAEDTLRVHYPLTSDSIVFDVGAYDGGWSADLARHTGVHPRLFVFEPLSNMAWVAQQRLVGENVEIVPAALSDKDGVSQILDCSHESSMHKPGNRQIRTLDIAKFIQDRGFTKIDLMSINVEGHEFEILTRLLETGAVSIIENLQIQFHTFVTDAEERRASIRERLAATHDEAYCYPFVWESWRKKCQVSG
jgi:FkbM family methyltransferase